MSDQESDLLTAGIDEGTAGSAGNQTPEGSGGNEGTPAADNSQEMVIPGWHDTLPKELKGNESLAKFDSHVAVAKAYVELEGKQGRMVAVPGENATDEEKSRFYAHLRGGINSPEEYDLSGAKLPDGVQLNENDVSSLRDLAFKNGWTQDAAIASVEYVGKLVREARRQVESDSRTGEAELRSDWGENYDANLVKAKQVLINHGSKGLNEVLLTSGLGSHPPMARFLYSVAEATSEGDVPKGDSPPALTGSAAKFPKAAAIGKQYAGSK